MSVYTSISRAELEAFLATYDCGALAHYAGIRSGIENTNYYVTTGSGDHVLTIFEKLPAAELPFFLDLTAHLAEHRIPCAHPIRNRGGHYLSVLKGKPAALVQRLRGTSLDHPDASHCAAVGAVLARMHNAGQTFRPQRENDRGPHWWRETVTALDNHAAAADCALLHEELRFQSRYRWAELPRGVIHADLFRDNVLFEGGAVSGLIDFYYACTDALLFDVAVTVNDWCSAADGALDTARARALLAAYHAERPLTIAEYEVWAALLRGAALRFWLSRLYDLHFPRAGEMTHTKDPDVFKRILINRIGAEYDVGAVWPTNQKRDHG